MKNILKNKLFIIFVLFILYFLFVQGKVKAVSNPSFVYGDNTYYFTLPDDCKNYIIAYDSNNRFHLFYSKDLDSWFNYGTRGGYPSVDCYTDSTFKTKKNYYRTWGNFYAKEQSDGSYLLDFKNCTSLREYDVYSNCLGLCYSSVDVYDMNDSSEIFFQSPHPLTAVMVREQAQVETMREIIQILPLILVVVVSFLGLRKALKMLLMLLRRCLMES